MSRIDTAIEKINSTVTGVKYIGRKWDYSERIWILSKETTSATTASLLCFDLNGNPLCSAISISAASIYCQFSAIDNYCIILYGTSNKASTFKVYLLSENTLSLLQTSPSSIGQYYVAWSLFAYKDSSGKYYLTITTNGGSVETPLLYNITSNTCSFTLNTSKRVYSLYFQYTTSGVRGLFWNHQSSTTATAVSYKLESTVNGSKTIPGSPQLSGYYATTMLPVFDYTSSYNDLYKELYTNAAYNTTTNTGNCVNVVMNSTYTTIATGHNTIDDYMHLRDYGAIIYGNDLYIYNSTSGDIEKLMTLSTLDAPSDYFKCATRTNAVSIGGTGTGTDLLVLYRELSNYGCKAITCVTQYESKLAVMIKDLYASTTGGGTSSATFAEINSGTSTPTPTLFTMTAGSTTDMNIIGPTASGTASISITLSSIIHLYLSSGQMAAFSGASVTAIILYGCVVDTSSTSFNGSTTETSLTDSYTGTFTPSITSGLKLAWRIKPNSNIVVTVNAGDYTSGTTVNSIALPKATVTITF